MPVEDDHDGSPRHSVSVSGVVRDERGRVLLVKRADNGQWETPGGVVGLDEELHEALLREIKEETGLHVRPGRLTGVYKNMTLGIVALVFECTPVGGQLQPSDETVEVSWFELDQLGQLVGDRILIRINDTLANLPKPAVRDHSHPTQSSPHRL
jgi:8-oxo-dGTP pyrophosphatase MutT (NUDIX family)